MINEKMINAYKDLKNSELKSTQDIQDIKFFQSFTPSFDWLAKQIGNKVGIALANHFLR